MCIYALPVNGAYYLKPLVLMNLIAVICWQDYVHIHTCSGIFARYIVGTENKVIAIANNRNINTEYY